MSVPQATRLAERLFENPGLDPIDRIRVQVTHCDGVDDAGNKVVVAEVFSTRERSSNVRDEQKIERRSVRVPWAGNQSTNCDGSITKRWDVGLALDQLCGVLSRELAERQKATA